MKLVTIQVLASDGAAREIKRGLKAARADKAVLDVVVRRKNLVGWTVVKVGADR